MEVKTTARGYQWRRDEASGTMTLIHASGDPIYIESLAANEGALYALVRRGGIVERVPICVEVPMSRPVGVLHSKDV